MIPTPFSIASHDEKPLPEISCLKCILKCSFIPDIKVIEPIITFTELTGNTQVEVPQLQQIVVSQLILIWYK